MRLVHLSDLHLGFRQYQRLTPNGINQREADVARSFQTAIDRIIGLAPDLVLIGGDVFHNVRPTNPAIVHAFLQFSRLRAGLPDTPVVMVAGNHDTPRAAETGSILRLFREIGIHVAFSEPQRFYFADREVAVLAVPDIVGKRPAFTPEATARYNVLLLHGEVQGMLPAHFASADRAALEIPIAELGVPAWDYVALGHYHVYREIAPNAYYSGSTDYTSANSWGELYEERVAGIPGKGFIEQNLENGAHFFHALPPSRPLIDLPPISARGLTVSEVDERILSAVDGCNGGIEEKIVRLIVRDLPRHIARDLDHKALRELKRRALHFHLDTRRPEVARLSGHGAPGRRPSLADVVREKLMSRVLENDIDRKELVALGLRYLSEAESTVGATPIGGEPVSDAIGWLVHLNSLRLCNFRQHADTRLVFDSGLTGIIGPNGAGKSTILEGIAWALYGTPAARGTRDSIRFNRAGARSQVRVELDFELGGHRYFVSRGLTNAELFLDGASSPIANTITGVTELLRRRLGMSLDEFFNTYFTGQKELSVMAAMGPSERAQFLSRVLGYEKLRTAQALVRERRRIILAEAAGLRAGMPDPESVARMLGDAQARLDTAATRAADTTERRTRAREMLDQVTPRWERLQRERERLQEILSELRVSESEAAGLARDSERLDRELADVAGARLELERIRREVAPLGEIVAALHDMDRLYGEEGRRRTLLESTRALAEDLARLRERRGKIEAAPGLEEQVANELGEKRRDLQHADEELEARRTDWVRDRQAAETKLEALRRQHAELKEQRERLVAAGEDGICPTCARPLGDHYRSVLDLIDDQLNTVVVDGNYFRKRLEQLIEMPPAVKVLTDQRRLALDAVGKLERRLARVQSAVVELAQITREINQKEERESSLRADLAAIPVGYDAARHEMLRQELERLQPLDARAARLGAQVEREGQLKRERERVTHATDLTSRRITELYRQREAVQFSEHSWDTLRSEYERAATELRAAELASVAADAEAAAARGALDTALQARRDLARSQTQLDELNRDKRLHDELDRAYSDMRTDLNVQLRPEISELASSFLTELTDARYSELELDDQYNVIVLEEGVPKPVISGGEEDLANLVLRLAISQMIAERAGQSFSLLILDEIFGSLDESRRHNVVELLRRLQDRFEQVILITHIESVREGLDRVITVRYDEETGASRVEHEPTLGTAEFDDASALTMGAAD